jgi:hypothetical protein
VVGHLTADVIPYISPISPPRIMFPSVTTRLASSPNLTRPGSPPKAEPEAKTEPGADSGHKSEYLVIAPGLERSLGVGLAGAGSIVSLATNPPPS